MGAEFLVASLWVVVLGYWWWTRRPTTADTVGLFRRELRVLEFASPNRVAPANRLHRGENQLPAPNPVLAAAASCHKRAEVRRRRRDVLCVLAVLVLLTFVVAVLSRSAAAIALQALSDVALIAYLFLLVRATRSPTFGRSGYLPEEVLVPAQSPLARGTHVFVDPRGPRGAAWPDDLRELDIAPSMTFDLRERPASTPVSSQWARLTVPVPVPVPAPRAEASSLDDFRGADEYVPAHAVQRGGRRVPARQADEAYGDFDSYASLALVR